MTTDIPFADLRAQYLSIKDEIDAAMAAVLADCAFIQGPHVQRFERAFAERLGVAHCAGCSNGTSGLALALKAVGIQAGDEVVTVSHTFFATAEAILEVGAVPVFADIDPRTHTLDPKALERAVTARTRAVVPVHLYGSPCDMDAILAVARRHGLKVVEDAAQAHLATYRGRCAGGLGDAASFSFFPGKNLGAYGDAGAVTSNDEAVIRQVRRLRDHGRQDKYLHDMVGHNHRMDGLQGAVLAVKLRHLDGWTAARRRLAAHYDRLLAPAGMHRPAVVTGAEDVVHLYVVEVEDRAAVQAELKRHGIASGVHYPVPCHLQPALAFLGGRPGDLPVTERVARRVISLPLFPEMTGEQVERVAATLLSACGA